MLQVYLHHLYTLDILDESVILNWHAKPGIHDDYIVESQKTKLREMVRLSPPHPHGMLDPAIAFPSVCFKWVNIKLRICFFI
jgi:hypothetical protein